MQALMKSVSLLLVLKKIYEVKERQALIDFRIAIERWEHHLFSGLTDFANNKIDTKAITEFYGRESELQLEVKISLARLGVVLQNEEVYSHAYPIIINISKTYDPLMNKYLPVLIDLQAKLEPIQFRMNRFLKNMDEGNDIEYTAEQAQSDQKLSKSVQAEVTEAVQEYSNELLLIYPKLVDQLTDLKIAMNDQVYRPITSDRIDED